MPSKKKSPQASSTRAARPKSKAKAKTKSSTELASWNRKAMRMLVDLVDAAQSFPALRKIGPKAAEWQAGVRVISSPEMKKLNSQYRGKDYATDVLSFGAPEPFLSLGYLGELVVALPVLKAQARELRHSPETELSVLLAHGILHLLGMDHEKGAKPAREQAAWEQRLLALLHVQPSAALITRAKRTRSK